MAAVGAVSCDLLSVQRQSLRERVELFIAPGVAGTGAQLLGSNESEVQALAKKFNAAESTIDAWVQSLMALQGTVVTLVDDYARSHTNVLLVDVRQAAKFPATDLSVALVNKPCTAHVQIVGVVMQV